MNGASPSPFLFPTQRHCHVASVDVTFLFTSSGLAKTSVVTLVLEDPILPSCAGSTIHVGNSRLSRQGLPVGSTIQHRLVTLRSTDLRSLETWLWALMWKASPIGSQTQCQN